jgi:isoleucyl-tRNA synthetase
VEQAGERLILAMDLVDQVIEGEYELLGTIKGEQMTGWKYEPLFHFMDLREEGKKAYEVVPGDFVTTEEGTGVVHTAVMYGEEDYNLGMAIGLPARHTVDMEGKFNELVEPWQGRFVKEDGFDLEIAIHLHDYSRLYSKKNYTHSYPYCWRCDSPLLYYGLDSWFVRMSRLRTELLANNEKIYWKPEHLKEGRFGNFLEEVKDWALSRNRFWGTPLPVWNCECGNQVCLGSVKELEELAGPLPEDFELHRPWVDDVPVKCPECSGRMEREAYVIDTWYDSGSAPFAQFHYPFENQELFKRAFPADFITEALDQTRGWFYTLLAVSTSVLDDTPYLNCLTQGLILNEEGLKMSKSKGTAIDPFELMNEHGADTLRLALFTVPCWSSTKFGETSLKEAKSKVVTTLWNVYAFFVSNANLDGFRPSEAKESDNMLDRWILSRLNTTVGEVEAGFENFELHKSVRALFEFVDDLSNWYLRRSRRRFWTDEAPEEKLAAHSTLYRVLCETSRMIAPITPFIAESIHQNLAVKHQGDAKESVHLTGFPVHDPAKTDTALEEEMALVRRIAETGRHARQTSGIKLRQPLGLAVCVPESDLSEQSSRILEEELNVKEIVVSSEAKKPEGENVVTVDGQGFTLYIDTNITPELRREGIARDVVRRIQSLRKELDLQYDQSIDMGFDGEAEVVQAIEEHMDYIAKETLAASMKTGEIEGGKSGEWKIQGMTLAIWIVPLEK